VRRGSQAQPVHQAVGQVASQVGQRQRGVRRLRRGLVYQRRAVGSRACEVVLERIVAASAVGVAVLLQVQLALLALLSVTACQHRRHVVAERDGHQGLVYGALRASVMAAAGRARRGRGGAGSAQLHQSSSSSRSGGS
jgi:hypothetical protein